MLWWDSVHPPKGHVVEAGHGDVDGQNLQEAQLKVDTRTMVVLLSEKH